MPSRPPNFLFIGPDKAGSTWLYQALKEHREVYLSHVKELFFFDRFYDKGWGWYLRFFEEAGEQHRIVGEICHDYLYSSVACQRIARDLPSVKLMVCLREPTQRAFSEYLYMIKLGLLSCDFETALREIDWLIDRGRYAKHLSYYLEHFGREQIYVAVFDDLSADPQRFFDGICDFLGLQRTTLSPEEKQKILPAAKPRLRHVARIGRKIGWGMRLLGLPGVVTQVRDSALVNRLLYTPYGPREKPEMSSCAREYLREVFSQEVRRLDALLGATFCVRWGYPASG
jgi:hypothetical protein